MKRYIGKVVAFRKSRKVKRNIGLRLIQVTLLLWIIDLTTKAVSSIVGHIICGEDYLCPVDGVICDRSCGFNTDMHLAFVFTTLLILGLALFISSKEKHSVFESNHDEANE